MDPEPAISKSSSKTPFIVGVAVLIVLAAAALGYFFLNKPTDKTNQTSQNTATSSAKTKKTTITKLTEAKKAFTGGFADPSILKRADGTYIMYLNSFGKVDNGYSVYTSPDAENWTKKTGVIFTGISVARAYQTESGIRFYYPEQMPLLGSNGPMPNLLSAFSTDGLTFKNDPGKRLTPREGHFMGGLTVFKLKDSTLRMYFEEPESADPNKRISAIWGASSTDGLTWTRDEKPTIEDQPDTSSPSTGWAQALHPFVVTRPDGNYLMFYNTHSELYAADSSDGLTWNKLGKINIHGADADGVFLPDGNFRLYYGDFSEQTSGEVYFVDLKIS
jgi:sucrose-6-phosphate hydrolase SacC (GH32 family)